MAAELLAWLVLEACVPTRHVHAGACSDNSATVGWQTRGASKRSVVANRLLRVLATRMRVNRASPLVTRHMAGKRNHLGDIPSRSFGYKAEWHHETDEQFLTFFNKMFPLPEQNCWTMFRLNPAIASKVTCELVTEGSSMDEWRRLAKIGEKLGGNGRTCATVSMCLPTWTAKILRQWPESQRHLEECSDKESEDDPSTLTKFEPRSAVSRRRLPWTQANDHCIKKDETTTSSRYNTC